jgi:hypothetical protein
MATFTKLKAPYEKYEMSETGIVRNIKTKNLMSKEKNSTSIRLSSSKTGDKVRVKISDLKLDGESKPEVKKTLKEKVSSVKGTAVLSKEPKEKKEKVARIPRVKELSEDQKELLKNDKKAQGIIDTHKKKHRQNYELSQAGYETKQIAALTNTLPVNVLRDLKFYKDGKYQVV